MHTYEVTFTRVKSYKLFCIRCGKWSSLSKDEIQKAEVYWNTPGFKPMLMHNCEHCGTELIVNRVGKYDKPNKPIGKCSVQCVEVE